MYNICNTGPKIDGKTIITSKIYVTANRISNAIDDFTSTYRLYAILTIW